MDIINSIKEEINYNLDNIDINELEIIKNLIIERKNNNIFFSGIGKCETIAMHIANLLKSLSYKSFYLNIQNSSHGDIGCLDDKSIILLFSKSGNTQELINFIEIAKLKKIKIISITCNNESKMKKISDYHYALPLKSELEYGIKNVPTNSCTLMLIFCNILVKLLDNIDIEEYKLNHLGGNIGNDLKTVDKIMIQEYPKLVFHDKLKIIDIVLEMTKKKIGFIIINNIENEIIGILSDGDIRRLLIKNENLTEINMEEINKNYYKIENTHLFFKDLKGILLKYKFIPIVQNKKCIGILHENSIKKQFY